MDVLDLIGFSFTLTNTPANASGLVYFGTKRLNSEVPRTFQLAFTTPIVPGFQSRLPYYLYCRRLQTPETLWLPVETANHQLDQQGLCQKLTNQQAGAGAGATVKQDRNWNYCQVSTLLVSVVYRGQESSDDFHDR